jgi:ketosteroid isomerase-like protein
MLTHEFATKFAESWIAAWNSHDLDRILSHYTDDFTMASPRIALVAGEPSGILKGKAAIGPYWRKALELSPHLHFEHLSTFVSADSIVIHYKGVRGLTAESLLFNDEGKVYRAAAHYM